MVGQLLKNGRKLIIGIIKYMPYFIVNYIKNIKNMTPHNALSSLHELAHSICVKVLGDNLFVPH